MNTAIHDTAVIRLLDVEATPAGLRTTGELWRGTVADFERINEFDDAMCAHFRTALHRDGRWVSGGGAEPLFVVEIVRSSYIVTSIGRKGARVTCFTDPIPATIAAAFAARGADHVLTIGPDGEYRAVYAATALQTNRPIAIRVA